MVMGVLGVASVLVIISVFGPE
ncbi:hypothetical protein THIOKS11820013 [Thiocapsa sp. KS1]|nr:hypothetical protein THIOKS11820013 [Thiocapsa sp. KS1]